MTLAAKDGSIMPRRGGIFQWQWGQMKQNLRACGESFCSARGSQMREVREGCAISAKGESCS